MTGSAVLDIGTIVSSKALKGGTWEFVGHADDGLAEVRRQGDGHTKRVALESLDWEGKPQPRSLNCTDAGNALRFRNQHRDNVRWVIEWKSWIVWDGTRWEVDNLGPIERAKDTARSIYHEAAEASDPDSAKGLAKWARASQSEQRLNAMVRLARSEDGMAVHAADLDADPMLLVFTNGTVDLRTGELRRSRRNDMLTKSTGHRYNPEATCPQIDEYLRWVTCDRGDLLAEVLRLLGYTLTGSTQERLMLVLHGGGSNGKSTLLKLVQHAFGEYGCSLPMQTLEKRKASGGGSGASPDVARLRGARYVSSIESEQGMPLSGAKVKELASDEVIIARQLYSEFVEFRPQHTLWLATNFRPEVPANDQALWNRIRLIPFDATVTAEEMDRDLDAKLHSEVEGFLALLVREAVEWVRHGLRTSTETLAATAAWREEMDTFRDFIEWLDEASMSELPVDYSPTGLRDEYREQAPKENWPPLNSKEFKANMEAAGWAQERTGDGRRWVPPRREPPSLDLGELALAWAAENAD